MSVIISVYNAYLNRGGEDEVFEAEADLLERHGHLVTRMRVEVDELRQLSILKRAKLAAGTIWSVQYGRRFRELIPRLKPDLVHFHNTFPLISPSAYVACQELGVPVVQTLHNFRLLCPNALFFRDGHICEDCSGKTFAWPGILHACYHNSRSQTSVIAAMLAGHHLRGTWSRDVDVYVATSEFTRQKFIIGGLPKDKILVKPNFLYPDPGVGDHQGDFALFVGRLDTNKGIETLLRTWELLDDLPPLHIVGDGPLAQVVEAAAHSNPNIQYLGRCPRESVLKSMAQARALIFPSQWYEGFPMTIVESLACGLPVIASRLGAMTEVIEDGRTGLHFEPGNAADLAAKVKWAWTQKEEMRRMGLEARREYESKYTADQNYDQLIKIYERALATTKKRSA